MHPNNDKKHDVLFQKLGNTWYVFTEIDHEFYYSALPDGMDPRVEKLDLCELIEEHIQNVATRRKKAPRLDAV